MTPETIEHVGTYLSFATARALPLAVVEHCLQSHRALDFGDISPKQRTKNAQALWCGKGGVSSRIPVPNDHLLIHTDLDSGETRLSLASEPVFLD